MAWAKSTYHSYIIFVTNNQTPLISLQCQTKKIVSVILRRWANKAIWIYNITEIRGFRWTYLWDNIELAIKYSWLKKGRKLLSTTNLCIIVKPGNTIMLSNSRTIFFIIQKFPISLFIFHSIHQKNESKENKHTSNFCASSLSIASCFCNSCIFME